LSGKTQVFTAMGDYHRTRLTHTQEVASIARTMGRALRLNEDLIEALALFHDIGHPPFGHAGEDALNECMEGEGGFSHNRYAITIAEELEQRYQAFPGLNLTYEVLDGQQTRTAKDRSTPTLEAQVVDAADSMTYDAHDTDDAVKLGLVALDEFQSIPLIRDARTAVLHHYTSLSAEQQRCAVVHELIERQVSATLHHTVQWLHEHEPDSSQAARQLPMRIGAPREIEEQKHELETFLYERVYRHEKLVAVRRDAQEKLKQMFAYFLRYPEQMPPRYAKRVTACGPRSAVADYLAGMTDRHFLDQFSEILGD